MAHLGVKLELGFLRQTFADWALLNGDVNGRMPGMSEEENVGSCEAARRARTRVLKLQLSCIMAKKDVYNLAGGHTARTSCFLSQP
ncbi:hypothetical protein QTP88_022634 [Uroleucon formosanum]